MVWVDSGNNVDMEIDDTLLQNISSCVQERYFNASVDVFSHNDYAMFSSHDLPSEIKDHYDYFGHGYPESYGPSHPESDYGPDDMSSYFRRAKVPNNFGNPYTIGTLVSNLREQAKISTMYPLLLNNFVVCTLSEYCPC
ncbi:uncharacterized protein SOCG_01884 [Schizosaccharomyces octosporus yFS286]|uniref:Uncharacterized protein n=1 Tax=Schizosaccharomyces octosporus (strain yFS286) TaxID=483514 RepID=S9RC30_SCHOY|nr:uncharacterized protein SOCG_01884 [Schizosaccharomyces octosporus yFS286]EPX71669.1 hypothetical protein SOCG_01884 [Schizosaccharomyces octosporus yFS286]